MVKFMAKNNIEENFKELDEILEKMQDEEVSLDESFEMYKKGKLERTVNYEDIIEIAMIKTWQNNHLLFS